jgi:hypothetical protein
MGQDLVGTAHPMAIVVEHHVNAIGAMEVMNRH